MTAEKRQLDSKSPSEEENKVIQEAKAELIKCGWRDGMLEIAKEAMASSSLEMTLEELIYILTKEGLESVPSSVKESILETMRNADGN